MKLTPRGLEIPRERLEAHQEEYEDMLMSCSRGAHAEDFVTFEWDWYGNSDVPNGTMDFKTYRCRFCGEEWT